MRSVDLDAIRERVGDEPCADCGDPSETFMVNERTVYVCFGCWSERHRKRAEERKKDPGKHLRAFHRKMARAYREVGDEDNARRADRLAG